MASLTQDQMLSLLAKKSDELKSSKPGNLTMDDQELLSSAVDWQMMNGPQGKVYYPTEEGRQRAEEMRRNNILSRMSEDEKIAAIEQEKSRRADAEALSASKGDAYKDDLLKIRDLMAAQGKEGVISPSQLSTSSATGFSTSTVPTAPISPAPGSSVPTSRNGLGFSDAVRASAAMNQAQSNPMGQTTGSGYIDNSAYMPTRDQSGLSKAFVANMQNNLSQQGAPNTQALFGMYQNIANQKRAQQQSASPITQSPVAAPVQKTPAPTTQATPSMQQRPISKIGPGGINPEIKTPSYRRNPFGQRGTSGQQMQQKMDQYRNKRDTMFSGKW